MSKFTTMALILAGALYAGDLDQALQLLREGKASEAAAQAKSEVDANPDNARAREVLGLALLGQQKTDEAEESLNKAVELAPDSASAQVGIARVAMERKQLDRAQEALNKAEGIDGGNAQVKIYKGALQLARKDNSGAIKTLEDAVASAPDEPYGHYYLGLAYYNQKRPDKTVTQFQRFLAIAPGAPEAARVSSLLRSIR